MSDAAITRECIRCGYSLAGLADSALCPECALPVRRSIDRSHLLRGADSGWLAQVRRGLRDLELAIDILVLFVLGAMVVGLALLLLNVIFKLKGELPPGSDIILGILMGGVCLAAGGLHMRGCWLCTRPTHAKDSAPPRTRAVVLFCGVLFPVTVGMELFRLVPVQVSRWIFPALAQANGLAFLFSLATLLHHYEQRTVFSTFDLKRRYRNIRKNLAGVAIIVLLGSWWNPWFRGGAPGGWGVWIFGIAYACMGITIKRVERAVAAEQAAAPYVDARWVGPHAPATPEEPGTDAGGTGMIQ